MWFYILAIVNLVIAMAAIVISQDGYNRNGAFVFYVGLMSLIAAIVFCVLGFNETSRTNQILYAEKVTSCKQLGGDYYDNKTGCINTKTGLPVLKPNI